MQKIPVQKWMISGNKDTLYNTLMEAVNDQKPGTILEQVIVVEEVEDPIDYAKLRRDKKAEEDSAKKAKEEQEKKDWEAKELDEKGNPIEEDKPKEEGKK